MPKAKKSLARSVLWREQVIAKLRDHDRVFVQYPTESYETKWIRVKRESKNDEVIEALADIYALGGEEERRRNHGWYKKHVILEKQVIMMNQAEGLVDHLDLSNVDTTDTFDGMEHNILIPYWPYDWDEVQRAAEESEEEHEEESDESASEPGSDSELGKRSRDDKDEKKDENPAKVARKDN